MVGSLLTTPPKEFRSPIQPPSPLVGGVEIIGVDGDAYLSTFYDSLGNVHRSRLEFEGNVLRWIGDRTRCTVTITGDGMTQVAHHESSTDGVSWTASMDVTLRKVA
jgi:hypothetical protein